jgi:hypothetical protein
MQKIIITLTPFATISNLLKANEKQFCRSSGKKNFPGGKMPRKMILNRKF